ncbi:hypothetical protein L218DRAFT_969681 [Marasmius fiardii PR-910]|nr:hypothetical protein L218DRAFT_969681 [Marasmius fiardii PR-910]
MAEYAHLSVFDPEIKPLLNSLPSFGSSDDNSQYNSIPTLRAGYEQFGIPAIQQAYEPSLPHSSEYTVADHHIDVGDGLKVLARSITPTSRDGEDGTFPVLFWIHGGAFVVGDIHLDDYRLRIVSVKLRISIVNCEYRLAPEHPFPVGLNDLTAALKYVASHPEKFSASLRKGFIVGGTSAGANLSAVLSHLVRDDVFFGKTPLTGQILHNPLVVHYQAYPEKYKSQLLSLEQNKDAPIFNKADIVKLLLILISSTELYKAPPADPRVSPLLLSSHKDLPPAFIQVYGSDPLRDEGLLYDKLLKEAGVPTRLKV